VLPDRFRAAGQGDPPDRHSRTTDPSRGRCGATRLRDRSRAGGKRAHGIAAKLRSRSQLGRDQVKDGVQRITGELADLAQATVWDAHHLLVNARRALRQARVTAAELAEAGVHDAAAGRRARSKSLRFSFSG
jgi:IS5 family transposase